MQDLLTAVERSAVVVRQAVFQTLGVLSTAENISSPLKYHRAMEAVAGFLPLWNEHRRLLSQAAPMVSPETGRITIPVLQQFEEDIADTTFLLEVASSAGWARTPELGINALRYGVATRLRNILRHLEKEQATMIPLLRRSAVPCVKQMAAA